MFSPPPPQLRSSHVLVHYGWTDACFWIFLLPFCHRDTNVITDWCNLGPEPPCSTKDRAKNKGIGSEPHIGLPSKAGCSAQLQAKLPVISHPVPWFLAIQKRLSLIPPLLSPSAIDCKQNCNIQHTLLLQYFKGAQRITFFIKTAVHLSKAKWQLLSTHPITHLPVPIVSASGHLSRKHKDEMERQGTKMPQAVKDTHQVECTDLASRVVTEGRGNGSSCPGHWGHWSCSA